MNPLHPARALSRSGRHGILFACGLALLSACTEGERQGSEAPIFSSFLPILVKPLAQIAGHFRWRNGQLSHRADLRADVGRKLRRFDIVFLSAPYKGTSLFIPGRFSHAGIWLGTIEDWRGIELPPEMRDALTRGRAFFHADREGARFSTIDEIFDADQVAIVRPSARPRAQDAASRIEMLNGRAYDFNFDGIDRSALMCTELIFEVFGLEPALTTEFFGRSFTTPDQMLQFLVGTATGALRPSGSATLPDIHANW